MTKSTITTTSVQLRMKILASAMWPTKKVRLKVKKQNLSFITGNLIIEIQRDKGSCLEKKIKAGKLKLLGTKAR